MCLPSLYTRHFPLSWTHNMTVPKTVGRSVGLHTARRCGNPDSSINCCLANSSVRISKFFHFHVPTLLSAKEQFIEFCRHERFNCYIMKKRACFDVWSTTIIRLRVSEVREYGNYTAVATRSVIRLAGEMSCLLQVFVGIVFGKHCYSTWKYCRMLLVGKK
jgi:hypothetical protein